MPVVRGADWRLTERLHQAKRISEAVEEGTPRHEVARELGISRVTLYRRLEEAKGARFGHATRRLKEDER